MFLDTMILGQRRIQQKGTAVIRRAFWDPIDRWTEWMHHPDSETPRLLKVLKKGISEPIFMIHDVTTCLPMGVPQTRILCLVVEETFSKSWLVFYAPVERHGNVDAGWCLVCFQRCFSGDRRSVPEVIQHLEPSELSLPLRTAFAEALQIEDAQKKSAGLGDR